MSDKALQLKKLKRNNVYYSTFTIPFLVQVTPNLRELLSIRLIHSNSDSTALVELAKQMTTKRWKTPIDELKNRPFPKTAGCLIIGDEILNGKTADTNSNFFAKFCFNLGIDLKRIEVIPDDEETIIEAAKRFSSSYDMVVTSGGIGSTHDDITYPSLARAFNLSLVYHQPTLDRMVNYKTEPSEEAVIARKRMALFPTPSIVVYPLEEYWVPIVIVNENVHILPGLPSLFQSLLSEYAKYLNVVEDNGFVRAFVKTTVQESFIAPVLARVQEDVKEMDIKVGSYPKWKGSRRWVIVSLLTRRKQKELVERLAKEVAKEIDGVVVDDPDA